MTIPNKLVWVLCFLILGCESESPAPEKPNVFLEGIEVTEGNNQKTVFVQASLDKAYPENVILTVGTEDGTAIAGEDYVSFTGKDIVFEPGDLIKEVSITILGDMEFEEDETFEVVIQTVANGNFSETKATITLLNDDIDTSLKIPSSGYSSPQTRQGYQLVWSDEFSGETLDLSKWSYEIGGSGWGNNEWQFYTDKNTSIVDGNLVIEARKEPFGGRQYTSSRIVTSNKYSFKYGRVDIRASLPFGQGLWPALWMLGENFPTVGWPYCGEIDIMEMIGGQGRENTVHGTAHWWDNGFKADFGGSRVIPAGGSYQDEYHVYSIIWNETVIQWYVDDVKYHEMNISGPLLAEFREPYFFIFNVAVGGNWPGYPDATTVFPQRMIVDYIRVFQP